VPTLRYTCAGERFARAARMTSPDQRLPGLAALATPGDLMLENDRVVAFFDAPDHPHHLATSGGALLDFAPRGGVDHLNHVYHITGILPRDGVRYVRWELVNAPDHAAVIFRGTLDGYPDIAVVTRYELRPCDPGLRVRTEVRHAGRLPTAWMLADAWFWGDRSMTPFAPGRGMGFRHPPLDLVDLDAGWRSFPWMAAQSHVGARHELRDGGLRRTRDAGRGQRRQHLRDGAAAYAGAAGRRPGLRADALHRPGPRGGGRGGPRARRPRAAQRRRDDRAGGPSGRRRGRAPRGR
jgi:hypothetical protein